MNSRSERGFTLIELIVTLVIMAIIATIAAPSFNDMIRRSRLTAAANEVIAGLQLARMQAISGRGTGQFCASSDGATCSGAAGNNWVVLMEKDGATQVIRSISIPAEVTLSASPNLQGGGYKFIYGPSGFVKVGANTSGSLSVCNPKVSGNNAVNVTSAVSRIGSSRPNSSGACQAPGD